MAVDLNGCLVVDQLFHLETTLCDNDVLSLHTLVYLELVEPISLRMLDHFLEVADLLEDRHFQQIPRADHAFPYHILDDNGDCLGRLNVDIVPI